MSTPADTIAALNHLRSINLQRLGDDSEAGLCLISLPWPAAPAQPLSLGGQPTHCQALGQWPETDGAAPRRLLLMADAPDGAPAQLRLTDAVPCESATPTARMVKFAECEDPSFGWERHYVEIAWGQRQVGLLLGLRTGGEVHWWEACALEVISESAECLEIEVGGAIPHELMTPEMLRECPGLENRFLHWHNWLNGHLYMRLHANGVCEVYAHHINSKFFDPGRDLADCVAVIGFFDPQATAAPGTWDGSQERLTVGDVPFDVRDAAKLATPDYPGELFRDDDFLCWQPYIGPSLFGGKSAEAKYKNPYIANPRDRMWLRGMARTVRFSFSLGDRSPRVARYIAPYWWYGVTAELYPMALLPASNELDARLEKAGKWTRTTIHQGGFEDGSLARGAPFEPPADRPERWEPSWEGDIPYAQFLWAWRTGEAVDYDNAMRSAYHFTDVAIDHADNVARMHGFPPVAFALPMNRILGTLMAYLETGDTYLLNTAEGVVEASHRQHLNSWPRMATGRDACYLRGAVMLYRYFANEHFRAIARRGISTVINSQRADGAWGDQGGGTGIHQWGAYIVKPWMGLLATSPLLDYVQLVPDPDIQACLLRFADWLLANRWERDGIHGWSYQHSFRDGTDYFDFYSQTWLKLPNSKQWHRDSMTRLFGWCTIQTGDPAYLDAWAVSNATARSESGDHCVSAALQFIPWFQAQLWRARLAPDGYTMQPLDFGPRTPREGTLFTPAGKVPVTAPVPG